MSETKALKILELRVSDFMRIRAVTVRPDGSVVKIRGKNGAGKSSLLEAITVGLGGAKVAPERPVNADSDDHKATIEIDLGDYRLRRTFVEDGKGGEGGAHYLKMTDGDGKEIKSPQAMLDALYSTVAVDPLAFSRMAPKDQAAVLMKLAGLDFTKANAARAEAFEKRRDANRDVERQTAVVRSMRRDFPEDLPAEEVYVPRISVELEVLLEKRQACKAHTERLASARSVVQDIAAEIERLKAVLSAATERMNAIANEEHKDPGDEAINAVRKTIAEAEGINQAIRQRDALRKEEAKLDTARTEAESWDKRLKAIDAKKADMLKDKALPVPGLTFDDEGVHLDGVPVAQASMAQKIVLGMAVAMAQQPRIRVVLVRDASILDAEHRALLAAEANKHGAQVWLELVEEAGEGGILLVDGEAKQP